jgi:SAM-dependent methyltransferase
MGLGTGILYDLIELRRRGLVPLRARVIEIGQQQLADPFLRADELLEQVYALFAARRVDLGQPVGSENFTFRAPLSRTFWHSLGCEYAAIDLAGDNVIELDLNCATVPPVMRGAFDIVVNGGTTEHIANQKNAFGCIHDLARTGGIMIHGVPSQGMITHGLVHYTPKFFRLLCEANSYEALSLEFSVGEAMELPDDAINFSIYYGESAPLPPEHRVAFRNCRIHAVLRKPPQERSFITPLDAA